VELTQEIMDIFATGATKGGETNWSERDDAAGLRAVLEFIDPVPSDVQEVKDKEGCQWFRADDPLIWQDRDNGGCLTARQIINETGGISW
jgi:hypothetical protein